VPRSVGVTKPHPLLRAFQGSGSIEIPIPWGVESGLGIGDVLVGEPLEELPVPGAGNRFASITLTFDDGELAFIAQRSMGDEIVRFEEGPIIGIDRACVCLAPRTPIPSTTDYTALDAQVTEHDGSWLAIDAGGVPVVAIKTGGDGEPFLYYALDASSRRVGWVLNVAGVAIPFTPPELPPELKGFLKPQVRYGLACRSTPSATFHEIVKRLGLPRALLFAPVRGWDGCKVGGLKFKEVLPGDFHFYEQELLHIAIPAPAALFRIMFEYHHVKSVPANEWKLMLATTAELARNTRGVLYQLEGEAPACHDFG
jgi:hypothetical protein